MKEEGQQVYMILSRRLPRKGRSEMELKPGEGQGAGLQGGAYGSCLCQIPVLGEARFEEASPGLPAEGRLYTHDFYREF